MSGFAGDLISGDLVSVEFIRHLYRYRKLFTAGSLVIDIFSVRLPGQRSVRAALKAFITRNVADVFQGRGICDRPFPFCILQPVTDNDRLLFAGCVRNYVYGFLFSGCAVFRLTGFLGMHAGNREAHCACGKTRKHRPSKPFHCSFHNCLLLSQPFCGIVVLLISESKISSSDGSRKMTHTMEIRAPLAISTHSELIISIFE